MIPFWGDCAVLLRRAARGCLGGFPRASCCLACLSLAALLLGLAPVGIDLVSAPLVVQPHVSLGCLAPGSESPVGFTAVNSTGETIKLLGVAEFCSDWGCVSNTSAFPISVSPHCSSTFSLSVRTRERGVPGEFNAAVTLYSNAPGSEQTRLEITGCVVARGGFDR